MIPTTTDCWMFLLIVAAVFVAVLTTRRGTTAPGDRLARPAAPKPLPPDFDEEPDGVSGEGSTSSRVAARAAELAIALEQATRLGGPDLISTYTAADVGKQLYAGYLERQATIAGGARLRLKVTRVRLSGRAPRESICTDVLYLVMGAESQDAGRAVSKEVWYWTQVRGRCQRCGAPGTGSGASCEYCGAEATGPIRWIVTRIEESRRGLG